MEKTAKIVFLKNPDTTQIKNLLKSSEEEIVCGITTIENINGKEISSVNLPIDNVSYNLTTVQDFSKESAKKVAQELKTFNPKIVLGFFSDPNTETENFLNFIQLYNKNIPLYGGIAAALSQKSLYCFHKKGEKIDITNKGAILLALKGETLSITCNYAFGWNILEKPFFITKAEGNTIYEIEGKKTADFYIHYLGNMFLQNLEIITNCFPLIVERNGNLVARACIDINHKNKAMIFTGNFKTGEKVYLGIPSERNILSEGRKLWWLFHKFNPEKIILFPCIVRKNFLSEKAVKEIKRFLLFQEVAGGYTFGEIYSEKSPTILNQTLTAVGLSFSKNTAKKPFLIENGLDAPFEENEFHNILIDMLTHLSNKLLKEVEEKNRKIKKLAEIDFLTGIYNRRKLFKELEKEIERSNRFKQPLSVMILDIDFFKDVNDTFGHLAGDKVLEKLANLIRKTVRKTDILGRYGGEEFLVILPHTDLKGATKSAEKIRQLIERHKFPVQKKITVSIGVTEYKHGESIDSLISRADEALYMAKRGGRNSVTWLI